MISIRINTETIPLPNDFSFAFSMATNILNIEDFTNPSFSLPITIPINEQSTKIFGFALDPDLLDVSRIADPFDDCAIQWGGNDVWIGAVEVARKKSKTIEIHFRFASGYIPTVNKRTQLRDFFKTETIDIAGTTQNFYKIIWPLEKMDQYKIRINGTDYIENTGAINDEDWHIENLLSNILDINVVGYTYDIDTNTAIIQSANNTPLTITAEYTQGITTTTVYVFESSKFVFTQLAGEGTIYELPPLYVPNLFNQQALNFNGFANTHEIGVAYGIPKIVEEIETSIIPCIKTKWLLEKLFSSFGIELTGDYITDAEFSERLEFVPRPIEKEVMEADPTTGLNISIPVSEFLPDLKIGDWLQSIKTDACASITYNPTEKVASINILENTLSNISFEDWNPFLVEIGEGTQNPYKGLKIGYTPDDNDQETKAKNRKRNSFTTAAAVDDLTALNAISLPGTDEIRFVKSLNAFYRWQLNFDGQSTTLGWSFYSHNLDDFTDTQEQKEIRSLYQPLVDTTQTINGRTMRMPFADVVGFFPQLDLTDTDYAPRFTIYRGEQTDLQANNYKMASIGIHKTDESPIAGAQKVFSPTEHPNAMDQKLYSEYKKILENGYLFTATFRLPLRAIQGFNPNQKIKVKNSLFLIKELNGELKQSGISLVSALLVRVN